MANGLALHDYYFDLPETLIAQHPQAQRDSSRLMYLNQGNEITHYEFKELPKLLKKGDCLVLNNTRVRPARLLGWRKDSGTAIEFLLLERLTETEWKLICHPGKSLKPGVRAVFIPDILEAEVLEILPGGMRRVRFIFEGIWEEVLDLAGTIPLPPYIHEKLEDPERYQTVYAKHEGSAAAPTAGLHFTEELLANIRNMGVEVVELTLHVGLGTFRPVREERIEAHQMHSEWYSLSEEAAERINRVKSAGGRVIAVGTTSCRVLESLADVDSGMLKAGTGYTDIFIYPGYRFKILDALITNFHLPESSLLMLVSALYGRERILEAYAEAVNLSYRFFSFGDAMFIVPEKD